MPVEQKALRVRGSSRIRTRVFTPHVHQKVIWDSNKKLTAAISGHHGGKSHIGPYWILREARKFPGDDFLICGPTHGTLKKAAIPKFLSLVKTLGLPVEYNPALGVGYRAGDREYRLPQGGIVYFVTADRPGSMQGAHCRGFWMDETVDTTYEVYETLMGRIAGFGGRGLITTTPYDMGWLYEHVYMRWKNGDPDTLVHQWRSIDNPTFPKKEWAYMKKILPPWRFRMLYEGQFERPMGLVYDCFKADNWIEPYTPPREWERVLGLDWGFTDPMACVWMAKSPENKIVLYDEFYRSGWMHYETEEKRPDKGAMMYPTEMIDEIVKRCKERGEKVRAVYCDPSRPEYVEYARERFEAELGCRHVYSAINSILPGIERCYKMVRSGNLYVCNDLLHFRDEQAKYQWETDNVNGEPLKNAEPIDKHNHLMDAWRYALAGSKDEANNAFGFSKISMDRNPLERLFSGARY